MPMPIDLSGLPHTDAIAVGLLANARARIPASDVLAAVEHSPEETTTEIARGLLVLARLLHIRALRRASATPGRGRMSSSATPLPGISEALGGDERLEQMTGDVIELFDGWLADDPSTEPLVERYARRWGPGGLVMLAVNSEPLLARGADGRKDMRWAVTKMKELHVDG